MILKRNPIIEEDLRFIVNSQYIPWDDLEGKNILIAGANGVLPAYMAETILCLNEVRFKRKATVYALVRNREKAMRRFAFYKNRRDLKFIFQDVCQPIKLRNDLHYIIHAASQASPKYYGSDPVGTLRPNTIGTDNLLQLARDKGVSGFLFFSAGEVYGEIPDKDNPVKESFFGPLNPMDIRSCYAESKRMGENMCVCWNQQFGVPAKIARIFHTYGPGIQLNDARVYADFVSDIINNRNIVMKSDGSARRAFCYLADATAGFFTVLLKGAAGEAYNLGNESQEVSIRELADTLVSLFADKKLIVETKKDVKADGYIESKFARSCPDTTRLRALGWVPQYSIKDGFYRTVKSFL